MNSLKNQENTLEGVAPPDADFLRALDLLRRIQLSGAVGMRVQQDPQKQQTTIVTFRSKNVSEQTLADTRELRQLLHLDPEATELKLVFGATASNDKELALLTRSLLHILQTMAAQVEIPSEDVAEGRATPGVDLGTDATTRQGLVRIHSSQDKPTNASVAIQYRGHWFWIDDRDLKTKRAFAFMMILFTLAETGEREPLPLITIPAQ